MTTTKPAAEIFNRDVDDGAVIGTRSEPLIERTPGLNRLLCAVYVFNARRD